MIRLFSRILVTALAALAASAAPRPAPAPERASLLLVTMDTTRADHIGCYGARDAETPTLDGLARDGARFARALSPVPLTAPAHATIMTGRLPREHGVRDNALFPLAGNVATLAENLRARGFHTAAVVGAVILDRSTGIDRGFEQFDDQVRVGPREWFDWQERAASQVVDAVLPLLDHVRSPFFVWVHFYDPHFPYVPPAAIASRFANRLYDGEIAFVDQQIGRLLGELRKRRLDRRLLVAVAGDHGESLGEHGEKTHGVFLYQSTLHVPLILHGPGAPAGLVVKDVVGLDDVAPTILDLLGAPALPGASGRSLVPLLRGRGVPARDRELESHYPRIAFGWSPLRGLLRWPYKFVLAPRPELYDVDADPQEKTNLADSRAALASDLRGALAARLGAETERSPDAGGAADPERMERLRSLGYAAAAGGQRPPASVIDPKDGIAWLAALDQGRLLLQSGKAADAADLLQPIVSKNPDNLEATLALIGAVLAQDPARAVVLGRQAVAHWPQNHLSHFNLANALQLVGRVDPASRAEAEREFRAALAIFPRHSESLQNLTDLLVEQGKLTEARSVFTDAERLRVEDPGLLVLRGQVEASLGDLDAADRVFVRALALDPAAGAALEGRGRIAYQKGDKAAAARFYQKALDSVPSAALARTLGAILLHDLNDKVGARRAFQSALRLEPQGPAADEVRAVLADIDQP